MLSTSSPITSPRSPPPSLRGQGRRHRSEEASVDVRSGRLVLSVAATWGRARCCVSVAPHPALGEREGARRAMPSRSWRAPPSWPWQRPRDELDAVFLSLHILPSVNAKVLGGRCLRGPVAPRRPVRVDDPLRSLMRSMSCRAPPSWPWHRSSEEPDAVDVLSRPAVLAVAPIL